MNGRMKICLAFLGNPLHDSRITNLSCSMKKDGCEVSVIGFDWFIAPSNYSAEGIRIFKLRKGRLSLFFYLRFALILIRELLKSDAGLFFAEDLYTLPFVASVAKLKRKKIYYNSREIYSFLGGLSKRPLLQRAVTSIERFFIKKVDLVMTTGEMDSVFLEKFYNLRNTIVIRNIPLFQIPAGIHDFRKMFGIAEDKFILLYQGVLLNGRGVPLIMRAMVKLPQTVLVLLGDGEKKAAYQKLAVELGITERIIFAGSIEQEELIKYTAAADSGLSLIENISISYYHALPNKLFEYIMAGLPVLASNLHQMKKIIDEFGVGEAIDIEDEENIVRTLQKWIESPELLQYYRINCAIAAKELNWQKEYERIRVKLLNIGTYD